MINSFQKQNIIIVVKFWTFNTWHCTKCFIQIIAIWWTLCRIIINSYLVL